jgi:hypothetical protein
VDGLISAFGRIVIRWIHSLGLARQMVYPDRFILASYTTLSMDAKNPAGKKQGRIASALQLECIQPPFLRSPHPSSICLFVPKESRPATTTEEGAIRRLNIPSYSFILHFLALAYFFSLVHNGRSPENKNR